MFINRYESFSLFHLIGNYGFELCSIATLRVTFSHPLLQIISDPCHVIIQEIGRCKHYIAVLRI